MGWCRQVVQFSHFSVKEFLMSNRLGDYSRYHINPLSAHTILTQACLGVLLHLDDNGDAKSVQGLPLVNYAAQHWVEHAKFEGVASRVKDGMETLFDSDKPHFDAWVGIYDVDNPYGSHSQKIPHPLYYSACCGFYDLVKHLVVKHRQHVNTICGRCGFPLFAALEKDHVEIMELLLEHGANTDARGKAGETILLKALSRPRRNLVDIVTILLKHGADVNDRDTTLRSPLHLAEYIGELKVAQMLLDHKPDINSQDKDGRTPLHILSECRTNDEGNVLNHTLLLLELGADVNKRDNDNETPLHLAIRRAWFKFARILLEHGAGATAENNNGKTALHILSECRTNDEDEVLNLAQLLFKRGAEVNRRDKDNQTPLLPAMGRDMFNLARTLLEQGADANAENDYGNTPLRILLEHRRYNEHDVINHALLLLELGADVNRRDKDNETPLYLAIRRAWFKLAEILLENGADATAENNSGKTPLHILSECRTNDEDEVLNLAQLLFKRGAEVNRRDKDNQTPLLPAMGRDMFNLARTLLEQGADANAENDYGNTPLRILLEHRRYNEHDVINHTLLLLELGADVNRREKDNETPLYLAIRRAWFKLAEILLENGADATAENNSGKTPLHMLSESRTNDEGSILNHALLLLELGADVDRRDRDNETPLHLAIRRAWFKFARILLEHGAGATAENNNGKTALHILSECRTNDEDEVLNLAQLLFKRGAVDRRDKDSETPLHLAIRHIKFKLAVILLRRGADANAENNKFMAPLHILSETKTNDEGAILNIVLVLLKHGADVNRRDKDNCSPLHLAIRRNRHKLARIILEHGADANAENNMARTPLQMLSESTMNKRNILNLAQQLLKNGAEINRRGEDNESPLYLAIRGNRFELAKTLLERGADTNTENSNGQTLLHILSESRYYEGGILNLALLLLKHGAEVNRRDKGNETPLLRAIRWDRFMLAKTLLKHGADSNAENNGGMTPFHMLSESSIKDERHIVDLALLLLRSGAEVNRRDNDNESPLHLAIRWDRFMLAKILLGHGADANAENNEGMTPLHILSESDIKDEGNILNIVLVLLENGAEVNRLNRANETPLLRAIRWDRFMLAETLLEHGADSNAENTGSDPVSHAVRTDERHERQEKPGL
jgi:ankyrin